MTVRRAPQLQRPVHVLLKGNKTMASVWLPWAKKKLHTLERYHVAFSGKSFGSMAYRVTSDVSVFIKVAKDQKWIIIEAPSIPGLYMESGVLDHRTLAPLHEHAWLPSILNYGDDIKAIRGEHAALGELRVHEVANNKLDGENRGEGDSKAIGCPKSEKLKELSVTIPTIFSGIKHKVFKSQVPKFCEDILIQKYWQQNRPPSMWSGKMRQMIQAIYGSKRTDYFIDVSIPNALAFAALKIKHGSFGWRGNDSTGLFSGRNHEYFAIYPSPDGIKARKLTPSPAGKVLQEYLNKNPDLPADRYLEYETYLLSTLYFTKDDETPIKIGEPGELFKHGGGLTYGPSWNWKGDTAYYATMNPYVDHTTSTHEAALHRISVAENDGAETLEDGRLVAATALMEGPTKFTFRVNEDILWQPDWINGGLNLFLSQADAFDFPDHQDTDVPMKVLYNYDRDGFDLVRFKRKDLGSGENAFGGIPGSMNNANEQPRCGSYFCGFETEADSAIEAGFYITELVSGAEHSDNVHVGKDGEGVVMQSLEVGITAENISEGGKSEKNPHNPGRCDDIPSLAGHDTYYTYLISLTAGGTLNLNGNFLFEAVLMIPFYDVDAVYLASRRSYTGSISTSRTTTDVQQHTGVKYYDWDTNEPLTGIVRVGFNWWNPTGIPNAPAQGVSGRAEAEGTLLKVDGNAEYNEIQVHHIFNGKFNEAHIARTLDDSGLASAMFVPACFSEDPKIQPLDGGSWDEGPANFGGYKTHFDPQYFFGTDSALGVYSKTSATHGSYAATGKNGGAGRTQIEDGGYDFDGSISEFNTFVGFA